MERLTKSDLVNGCPVCYPKSDSGLPELVMKSNPYRKIIEKLKEYEDLEEQGKLWKLPCAPGQPVWKIKNGKIQKWFVGTIKIEGSGVSFCNVVYICDISDFGKTVFFTREEAEAALKRMEV